MAELNEERILREYVARNGLKNSRVRIDILRVFLGIERHLTLEELYHAVRQKHPGIGYATVYRTLKLFCSCGLCRELRFEGVAPRYEHLYGHRHHDHLICTRCATMIEVVDEQIEVLQAKLFKRYGFSPQKHRMELYGLCKKCKDKQNVRI